MLRTFLIVASLAVCLAGCVEDAGNDMEQNALDRKLLPEETEPFAPLSFGSDATVIYQTPPDEREPRYKEWIISIPGAKGKPAESEKYGLDSALIAELFDSRGIVFSTKDVVETWTVLWSEGGFEYRGQGVVLSGKTLVNIQRF